MPRLLLLLEHGRLAFAARQNEPGFLVANAASSQAARKASRPIEHE
jgi:hypothetical protein